MGPVGWAEDNTIKALKAKMKDPDSMVVRSSYFVQTATPSRDSEIAMRGIADGKNGSGGYICGTRFVSVSLSNKNTNTFDTYSVRMDESGAMEKAESKRVKMFTGFEKVCWNGHCVDEIHTALVVEE